MQIGSPDPSRRPPTSATRPASSKSEARRLLPGVRPPRPTSSAMRCSARASPRATASACCCRTAIDCLVAYYALAKAGLVRVGMNTREPAPRQPRLQARRQLARGGSPRYYPTLAIAAPLCRQRRSARTEALEAVVSREPRRRPRRRGRPGARRALRLGYTGGTTGRSKAVTLTTRGELSELSAFLSSPTSRPTARGRNFLHAAPIAHASGAFFLPSLVRGLRVAGDAEIRRGVPEFAALRRGARLQHTFLARAPCSP